MWEFMHLREQFWFCTVHKASMMEFNHVEIVYAVSMRRIGHVEFILCSRIHIILSYDRGEFM